MQSAGHFNLIPMATIVARFAEKRTESYKIFIRAGVIKKLPKFLKRQKIGRRYAIVTDSTVQKLFGNSLLKTLREKGIDADMITFPQGEKSKNLKTLEHLAEEMVKKGFSKKDAVIALGGGVVGDLAGFLASVYMRGIPFIHIPTTLMAMVDSSVGGKTGADLKSGKNLLGTITQPKAVFMDLNYLKNLPEKQMKNGLAEVIKYGVIYSKRFFNYLERNMEKILAKDPKAIEKVVWESIKIKTKVVERDEKDKGIRIILNYGHTYGHALEKLSNYTLLHGLAISIGMVEANKIAMKNGYLGKKQAERIKKLLKETGLPVTTIKKVKNKDLATDKKRVGNHVVMVLPKGIGKTVLYNQKCV